MKDRRSEIFRTTLEGLIESLEATIQVARWVGPDPVPQPLSESASKLIERLGAAGRLAGGVAQGTAAEMSRVNTMLAAMRRLDAAYVACRKTLDRAGEGGATALEAAIAAITADKSWQRTS